MSARGDERSGLRAAMVELDPAAGPAVLAADPVFARRVLAGLPELPRGTRLSPHRRARVLAAFYGGAVALGALWVAWVGPESVLQWLEGARALAHGVVDPGGGGELRAWPLVIGAVAAAVGGVLALAPARIDTPAT